MASPRLCRLALGLLFLTAYAAASPSAIAADIDPWDGQWHGAITPYGWFPAFTTDIDFVSRGGSQIAPSVEVKPSNYLKDLQFAGMLNANARKGDLIVYGDLVYADIAGLSSKVKTLTGPGGIVEIPLNADLNVKLAATIVTAGVGTNVWRAKGGFVDIFGGVQYANIRTSVDANLYGLGGAIDRSDAASNTTNLWDGIVGITGNLHLSDDGKWYVPFEAHIGAGNSNWTWNGIVGVGYRFDWGALVVAWRALNYDASGDSTVQKLQMSGPAIGATFRW